MCSTVGDELRYGYEYSYKVSKVIRGSKQIRGTRPAPAYHHSVHAGELAHPAQPENLE